MAPVRVYEDWRVGGEVSGEVEVEGYVGGIGTEFAVRDGEEFVLCCVC